MEMFFSPFNTSFGNSTLVKQEPSMLHSIYSGSQVSDQSKNQHRLSAFGNRESSLLRRQP